MQHDTCASSRVSFLRVEFPGGAAGSWAWFCDRRSVAEKSGRHYIYIYIYIYMYIHINTHPKGYDRGLAELAAFLQARAALEVLLYYTILYHTIRYYTIPYHTILYYTIPYHTIPYHYYTIQYYTTLCYAML